MARQAFEPFVLSDQFERGIRIMIESPDRPSIGVVALATFSPQPFTMDVFRGMARSTRGVLPLERLIPVTRLTRRDGMQAQQRKTSQIMVE